MPKGVALAWLAGLGIFTWRTFKVYRKPPVPGRVLAASVVFAALALLAEYEPAARFAALAAWGFDVAVLFSLPPSALTGSLQAGGITSGAAAPGTTGSGGGGGSRPHN